MVRWDHQLNGHEFEQAPGDGEGLSGGSVVKKKICLPVQEMQVQFLGLEDPLEKDMATHSNILDWEIPWTEEPGRLQSIGSQSRIQLSD